MTTKRKKLGTKGMRLWSVKLAYQTLGPNASLWIVTRSRNLSLAVAKAEMVLRKEYPGRKIDAIEYKGTIDN